MKIADLVIKSAYEFYGELQKDYKVHIPVIEELLKEKYAKF